MALLFMDGFDHYNGGLSGKWNVPVGTSIAPYWNITSGRWGGRCAVPNQIGIDKTIFPLGGSDLTIGFAAYWNDFNSNDGHWFALWDGPPRTSPHKQFQIEWDSNTREILLCKTPGDPAYSWQGKGDIILHTGYYLPVKQWTYVEWHFNLPLGSFEMRVMGETVSSGSGLPINDSGSNKFTKFRFKAPSEFTAWGNYAIDDLYVLDSSGVTNNTFLGEIKVQTRLPVSPGFRNDFIPAPLSPPPAEGNAHNVNNPVVEYIDWGSPAHYNTSKLTDDIDTYALAPFTSRDTSHGLGRPGPKIFAVQNSISYRKDDVGIRSAAVCSRRHTKDLTGFTPTSDSKYGEKQGSLINCHSEYRFASQMLEKDPETNLQWVQDDLNVTDVGVIIKG